MRDTLCYALLLALQICKCKFYDDALICHSLPSLACEFASWFCCFTMLIPECSIVKHKISVLEYLKCHFYICSFLCLLLLEYIQIPDQWELLMLFVLTVSLKSKFKCMCSSIWGELSLIIIFFLITATMIYCSFLREGLSNT